MPSTARLLQWPAARAAGLLAAEAPSGSCCPECGLRLALTRRAPLARQYDLRSRRTFLKRCDYPSVTMDQLFIGSIITVYSRQLKVVEYADAFTTREFERKSQNTVAMVMQEAMADLGKIIDSVCRDGFTIAEMRMLQVASIP